MSQAPDPADARSLDAAADGGFQTRGTRFASLDELLAFGRKGGNLTTYETEKLVAYVDQLRAGR